MKVERPKLLIYAHYYIPDVASTGQILKELAEGMLQVFDITVICVVPSYTGKIEEKYKAKKYFREEINGVKIVRVGVPEFSKASKSSRIRNIITYFFRAMFATFKVGKKDYIFSISQPPILGGLLGVWGKWVKRAKFIYNIQDFNPEQIMAVGYSNNKIALKIMMAFDKFTCCQSDKVIVVGRDMVETLKGRFNHRNVPTNVFINNWIDEEEIYPLPSDNEKIKAFKRQYDLENKFVIMYSGNIGLYYDLINLFGVIKEFKDRDDVVFAFVGEGTVKDELISIKDKNNLDNVRFIPYQDKEDLIYSLNAGDVHWCINAKGIKGVSVPSKLYGIIAAGKPVLGVLEENSEGRLIIEETNCGYLIKPGNYEEIKFIIERLISDNKTISLSQMGESGRSYLTINLTRDISINKYMKEILNT